MKKTLLELMIEDVVQWPDGAEFASQDKEDKELYFYRTKPERLNGNVRWSAPNPSLLACHTLPTLCKNWHQTIVTREQYEAAKANPVQVSDVFHEATETPNTPDTDKQTLDEKLSRYQWANNELAKAIAIVADWTDKIKELEDEVAAELASFGRRGEVKPESSPVVEPVEELNITDWRDLQVGDVIVCLDNSIWCESFIGKEVQVIELEHRDYCGILPIHAKLGDSKDWGCSFKFIHRPTK